MLPLKSSRNEQHAIIVFLWAKKIIANQIHSMSCIQYMATSALEVNSSRSV